MINVLYRTSIAPKFADIHSTIRHMAMYQDSVRRKQPAD